jgi:hypothetical protein
VLSLESRGDSVTFLPFADGYAMNMSVSAIISLPIPTAYYCVVSIPLSTILFSTHNPRGIRAPHGKVKLITASIIWNIERKGKVFVA